MSIGVRIKEFRKSIGQSQTDFATSLSIKQATLSQIETGVIFPSLDVIKKIIGNYNISYDWLIDGKGNATEKEEKGRKSKMNILPPVITVDAAGEPNIVQIDAQAAAGLPRSADNPEYFKALPAFSFPGSQFKSGQYICIQVVGDSMHSTIYHHDWLIAKYLDDPKSDIREGYVHIVVTRDGVVAKRLLNRIEKRGKLVLMSDNEQYPTYEEDIENVIQVYKVEGKISFNLRNENADLRTEMNNLKGEMVEMRAALNRVLLK